MLACRQYIIQGCDLGLPAEPILISHVFEFPFPTLDRCFAVLAFGSYRSYQRFYHINEAKGSFSVVLTP